MEKPFLLFSWVKLTNNRIPFEYPYASHSKCIKTNKSDLPLFEEAFSGIRFLSVFKPLSSSSLLSFEFAVDWPSFESQLLFSNLLFANSLVTGSGNMTAVSLRCKYSLILSSSSFSELNCLALWVSFVLLSSSLVSLSKYKLQNY